MMRNEPSIIIQPPSQLQDLAPILAMCFCFALILFSIYFAVNGSASSGAFSLIGAAFFVFIIFALKGAFRR